MAGYRRTLVALGILLPANCRSGVEPTSIDPTDRQSFVDGLTSALYSAANECSSALGVAMALSLIYPGTVVGNGREQIRDALGYPEAEGAEVDVLAHGTNKQLVWEEETEAMLADAAGQCVSIGWDDECASYAPLLKIANSVWIDDGSALNANYEEVVGDFAKRIDFESIDSPAKVNEWVTNSTNGLIDSILEEGEPLFPPYVLIAINSIYLKARWGEQFHVSDTNLDAFYDSASRMNEISEARFMHMVSYFRYSHEAMPGYQVIDMPFAGSDALSMIFVLPQGEGSGLVASERVITAVNGLNERRRVALALPKFKFESEYDDDLKEALVTLGIADVFTAGTGALCGIFNETDQCDELIIDKFVQKTAIDVNEKGVEAAAVTAAMAMATSDRTDENVPVEIVLDHPFQFFVYDNARGVALFEGRVGAPEVPKGEEAPALEGSHSNADFWSEGFGVVTEGAPVLDAVLDATAPPEAAPSDPSPSSGASDGRARFNLSACPFFGLFFGVCLVEMGADLWVVACVAVLSGFLF